MATVNLNGIQMHYQQKGEGPDVVLVHGLTSSLAYWYATRLFAQLSRQFRVTAYDLRGHGYSQQTKTGYTSLALAEDLLALLDHLEISQARLIGHSFGGSIVLHFALLHPERTEGAVLCDTGFAALRHLRRIDDWPGWEIWKNELPGLGITPEWFADADAKGITAILEKSYQIPVQFGMRRGESRDTPRFRKLLQETSVGTDFRDPAGLDEERLKDIATPVLAVYGEISPFRKVALFLEEQLPHAVAEIIPGVGHFFLMQALDGSLERILPFLADPSDYVGQRQRVRAASAVCNDQPVGK